MTIRQEIIRHLKVADAVEHFESLDEMKDYFEAAVSEAELGGGSKKYRAGWVTYGNYLFGLSAKSYRDLWIVAWRDIEDDRSKKMQMERWAERNAEVDMEMISRRYPL